MNAISSGLLYLISTTFNIYLFILIARLLLAYSGAHYFNPVTQLIITLTDFLVKPIRRFIPNVKGIELSTVVIILLIEMLKYIILFSLTVHFPNLLGVIIISIADLLNIICNTLFYAILLQALLSWIQPVSPLNQILATLTSPIIKPLRRFIPLVNGFDITPIPALIILQLINIVLISPIALLGHRLALGQ